jgi:hypothetical protein
MLQGEERQYFIDKICELRDLVIKMPATYEQDDKGESAVKYTSLETAIGTSRRRIPKKFSYRLSGWPASDTARNMATSR